MREEIGREQMEKMMAFARSEAGQKLLAVLQQQDQARQAMEKAAAGNFQEAKQLLSRLMQDEETASMLRQFGR